MDYEEIGNFTNSTYDKDLAAAEMAQEIIFIIFCTLGVCADTAIIVTILRFKRMRTKPNLLLANWAIADLCCLLVTPSGYRMIDLIHNITMSPLFLCGLLHFGTLLHFTVVVFVIVVSVDWFIAAYFPNTSETIRSYQRYIIGIIWLTSLLGGGITTGICLVDKDLNLVHYLLFPSFWLILIITVILQSSRAIRKYCLKRPLDVSNQMLTLTTAFIGCWILCFVTVMFKGFLRNHIVIEIIALCLLFSNSLVNLTILYLSNKDFKACLHKAFKRSGIEYEQSICNIENSVDTNSIDRTKIPVKLSSNEQNELM